LHFRDCYASLEWIISIYQLEGECGIRSFLVYISFPMLYIVFYVYV
jgi:hypothetical protein